MEEGLTALAGVGCWAKASILGRDLRTHEGQGLLARSHQAWEGARGPYPGRLGSGRGLTGSALPAPTAPPAAHQEAPRSRVPLACGCGIRCLPPWGHQRPPTPSEWLALLGKGREPGPGLPRGRWCWWREEQTRQLVLKSDPQDGKSTRFRLTGV